MAAEEPKLELEPKEEVKPELMVDDQEQAVRVTALIWFAPAFVAMLLLQFLMLMGLNPTAVMTLVVLVLLAGYLSIFVISTYLGHQLLGKDFLILLYRFRPPANPPYVVKQLLVKNKPPPLVAKVPAANANGGYWYLYDVETDSDDLPRFVMVTPAPYRECFEFAESKVIYKGMFLSGNVSSGTVIELTQLDIGDGKKMVPIALVCDSDWHAKHYQTPALVAEDIPKFKEAFDRYVSLRDRISLLAARAQIGSLLDAVQEVDLRAKLMAAQLLKERMTLGTEISRRGVMSKMLATTPRKVLFSVAVVCIAAFIILLVLRFMAG